MDENFGLHSVTLLHNNISVFFDYNLDREMSVKEFIVGFHSRFEKISKLDMTDELEGQLLLTQASLKSHERNLVVGTAGGYYSLQALATSSWNAFRPRGFSPLSMNSSETSRHYQSLLRPIQKKNRSNQKNATTLEPGSTPDPPPLFLTFLISDDAIEAPSTITESGACATVVGKDTLNKAMPKHGINELNDENICQREHRFGPSNND